MCELLGMSANVPTDICFSFTGFLHRGGGTGPHRDGWGIAFYEEGGYREFRDPHPSVHSRIARLICEYPIKSNIVISHIRQANVGGAASAPVVAAAFHPSLATVGVLLAVFGYVVGTYGAILCTILMQLASGS